MSSPAAPKAAQHSHPPSTFWKASKYKVSTSHLYSTPSTYRKHTPEPDGVSFIEKPVVLTKQRYRVTPTTNRYKKHKNPSVPHRKTPIPTTIHRQCQQQQNKQINNSNSNYYHPLTTIIFLEPISMDDKEVEEAMAEKARFQELIGKKDSKNDNKSNGKHNKKSSSTGNDDNNKHKSSDSTVQTEEEDVLIKISKKYLPKEIKTLKFPTNWDEQTKPKEDAINIGISFCISRKAKDLTRYNIIRIVNALGTILLSAVPDLILNPTEEDDGKVIKKIEDLPTTEEEAKAYIENPKCTRRGDFYGRIHVSTIKPIEWILKNHQINAWLTNEKIELTQNDLTETMLLSVGFLIKCHPDESMLEVQMHRLRGLMPKAGVPEFHVRVWHAKSHDKSCPTLVIQTAISDVERMTSIMESIQPVNLATFYSWKDWHNSSADQRQTKIREQNVFLKDFKSLNLNGFKDYNQILMGNDAHDTTTTKFSTMNLNDFIINKFVVGPDKQSLVAKITKPVLGWREFMVIEKFEDQATDLLKLLKMEIIEYASVEAAQQILVDYDIIVEQHRLRFLKWKPNKLQEEDNGTSHHIPKSKTPKQKSNKRIKGNNGIRTSPSYANAAKKSTKKKTPANKPDANVHHRNSQTAIKSLSMAEAVKTTNDLGKETVKTTTVSEKDPVIFQMKQQLEFLQVENKSILQKVENLEKSTSITKGEVIKTNTSVAKLAASVKTIETNISTFATKDDMNNGFTKQTTEMNDMTFLLRELVKGMKVGVPTPDQIMPPPLSRILANDAPTQQILPPLATNPSTTIGTTTKSISCTHTVDFIDLSDDLDETSDSITANWGFDDIMVDLLDENNPIHYGKQVKLVKVKIEPGLNNANQSFESVPADGSFDDLMVDLLDENNPIHHGKQVKLVKVKIEKGLENIEPTYEELVNLDNLLQNIKEKPPIYDTRRGEKLTTADKLFEMREDAQFAKIALETGSNDHNNRSPLRERSPDRSNRC